MKKNIFLLGLGMLLTAGFASCGDDDEPSIAAQVAGTYIGYSIAHSSAGHFANLPSTPDTIIVGAISDTQVNIILKSNLWGHADYKNITVTQDADQYLFQAVKGEHTFGRPGRPETFSTFASEMAASRMATDHKDMTFTFSTHAITEADGRTIDGGVYTITFHNGAMPIPDAE